MIRTAEEHLLSDDRRRLTEAADILAGELAVSVTSELDAGTVVDQLCGAAERHLADLLVIGSGKSRSVTGSTAERIVRNVRVPVLAVRSSDALEAWLTQGIPLRVLVGSDLGVASRNAESFLSLLHRAGPLDVQVACVAHPVDTHARYDLPPPHDVNVLDPAAEQLVLRELAAQGHEFAWRDRRTLRVVTGTASAETHLALLAEHADLVLVGARKRSWLAEAWYGSVASGMLRYAPTSVVSVPRALVPPQIPSRARARVVVAATDFSDLGDEALSAALALTDPDANLYFVHVLSGLLEDKTEERIAAHRQLRQRVPADLGGRHVHVDILSGHPAEAIVAFARRVGAETLCLGSRGRTGVGALVLGSTSQEVLARAQVPVLIIPPLRE